MLTISTKTIQEAKSNVHPYISHWLVCHLYVYSVPDCQDWSSQIPQWGKISPPGWSYPSLSACRVQIQQHCTQIKIQTSASVIPSISENLDWWKTVAENELCTYPTCRSPSRLASSIHGCHPPGEHPFDQHFLPSLNVVLPKVLENWAVMTVLVIIQHMAKTRPNLDGKLLSP